MFINIVLCALRQQQTSKKTKCNKQEQKKMRKVCDIKKLRMDHIDMCLLKKE